MTFSLGIEQQVEETVQVNDTPVDPPAEMEAPNQIKEFKKPLNGREVLKTPPLSEMLKQQSVPVKGREHVRRSPRVDDGVFFGTTFDGVYTVHDMFMHGYKINHDAQCAGWRPKPDEPYKWVTYQQVYEKICKIGSGLIEKGAQTNQDQFIGIYAKNSLEWLVIDRVCAAYSMVSVPLYDTLGPESMTHIVNQCELGIIIVDTNERTMKLLADAKSGKTNTLKLLVVVETPTEDTKALCKELSIGLISWDELEEEGKACGLKEFVPPKSDDLFTVCYTSGTTGAPKGVMHTNLNVVALACAFLASSSDYFYGLSPSDVLFSYLPLAHVFERYIECGVLMHGGSIGFYQGNPKLLMDDAATLKPTIFPMVPRLVNRIYGKIMTAVGNSGMKKAVFDFCLNRKMSALKKGNVSDDTIWDKLVFHKFQAVLGGRVKLSICAAAPISAKVLNVVRCVMGIPIVEGYGQTETTSGFVITLYKDYEGGNVGSVLPNMEIKLVDVPEKEYYAKDNKGEICCKGLCAFKGYYKNEEKTKETIDEDGWVHTGDIGEWLPNGALKIIDRRKNIFKLSQGEYIAPEKIEQLYTISDAVGQVYVHGDSIKSNLVGIVIPDEDNLAKWCKEKGVDVNEKSFADLCSMTEVAKLIMDDMNKIGRQNGLKSFELVKKVHLDSDPFTVENNLITPTLKSRRIQIEKKYRAQIDHMYEDLD
uniref:long-chain-fatty-acid--CoA ligase 1-like isoform X2 n=1 Tax=Styela clava TaxID=7725 RepID=UPI00193A0AE9|nr:long-chain-fatty-acid--CoA ligase 1-like isoform X2 [Styela clava]